MNLYSRHKFNSRILYILLYFVTLLFPVNNNAQDLDKIIETGILLMDSARYIDCASEFPDSSALYSEISRLYGEKGSYDTALICADLAISKNPENLDARTERMIIYMILDNHISSMEDAKKILSVVPDDLTAIYCLAAGLMNTGDLEESKNQIQKGIEFAPKLPAFYSLMSKILIQQHSHMEGEMFINRAIELAPHEIGNYLLKAENTIMSITDPAVLQEDVYPPKFFSIKSADIKELDKLIRRRQHPYFYKTIADKFNKDFRSLTLDEYFMFYFGYTITDTYAPYAQNEKDLTDSIISLMNQELPGEAAASGSGYLSKNPTGISVYYHTGNALLKSGKIEKAEEYFYKYQGFISSIIASGDGNSPESAYIVISPDDEYTVMQYLGYSVYQQDLQELNKHYFDVLTVITHTGEEKKIYFNIDKLFDSLSKQFR